MASIDSNYTRGGDPDDEAQVPRRVLSSTASPQTNNVDWDEIYKRTKGAASIVLEGPNGVSYD